MKHNTLATLFPPVCLRVAVAARFAGIRVKAKTGVPISARLRDKSTATIQAVGVTVPSMETDLERQVA